MSNEERKHEKAIKKIEIAVGKALDKGVSKKIVQDTVGQAIVKAAEKIEARKVIVKRTPAKKAPKKKVVAKKAPAKKPASKEVPAEETVAKPI